MWEILLGLQGKVQIGEVIFIAILLNMVANTVTIMGTTMVTNMVANIVANMVTNMVTNIVANMHRLTFSMRGCLRDLQVGSPASSAEPPFDISLM